MIRFLSKLVPQIFFRNSASYWEMRYRFGGDSGAGSYGEFADYKADILNTFVAEHEIKSVIEFGCGDGNQLSLASYPQYLGIDVSPTAISRCRKRFHADASKMFLESADYHEQTADLAISLDVLFHLVEDDVYQDYLDRLFAAGNRFVIIYSTSTTSTEVTMRHVRHRDVLGSCSSRFPEFELLPATSKRIDGHGQKAEFFIYRRRQGCPAV